MLLDEIARSVVHCSYLVHKELGPGLLEKIYEACLCYELQRAGYKVERQVSVPIVYGDLKFSEGYRVDVLVQDCIICEIKAVEKHNSVWDAQLLSYMKLMDCRLGFLLNFNVPVIKNGIKRMIR
jgi:GxxExxY protein